MNEIELSKDWRRLEFGHSLVHIWSGLGIWDLVRNVAHGRAAARHSGCLGEPVCQLAFPFQETLTTSDLQDPLMPPGLLAGRW